MRNSALSGGLLVALAITSSNLYAQNSKVTLQPGEYLQIDRLISFSGSDPYKNIQAREPTARSICLTGSFEDFIQKRSPTSSCRRVSGPSIKNGRTTLKLLCKSSNKELTISSDIDASWDNKSYLIRTKNSMSGETVGVLESNTEGYFVYSTPNSRRCNGVNDR